MRVIAASGVCNFHEKTIAVLGAARHGSVPEFPAYMHWFKIEANFFLYLVLG